MRKFLLLYISFIQTLLGIVIYVQISSFFDGGPLNLGLIIFLLILEALLAILVAYKIREYEVVLPIIVEFILSPFALFRYILGWVLALAFKSEFTLEPEGSELLNSITEYLLYFEVSDTASLSKTGNLISLTLFALPITFIMFYSFWNDIFLYDWALTNLGIEIPRYNIVIGLFINLFLTGALCVIRSQATEYESYNANYKFKNTYTGKKEKRYSEDHILTLTKQSMDRGWTQVSGGYETHFTAEMIITFCLSPFLFFTYLVGTIAAALSYFITPIYSCIGSIDYDDVPLGDLQKILHFLFVFVICPDLKDDKEYRKEMKKAKSEEKKNTKTITKNVTKNVTKNNTKPLYKYNTKTVYKRKKSFKEIILSPFEKLVDYFKDNCDSAGEFILCLLSVIFFPVILIFKLIKLIIEFLKEHCEGLLGFFIIIGKILISPILLIKLIFSGISNVEVTEESVVSTLVTLVAAILAFVYLIMIRTGFLEKLTFELGMSWLTSIFSKFFFTNVIAGWFEGAGILCILLAILIAIVAVIEFLLLVIAGILAFVLMLLGALLQVGYIILIPLALIIASLIFYFKGFSETGVLGKLLGLIFIAACTTFVILYYIDLHPLMFPN